MTTLKVHLFGGVRVERLGEPPVEHLTRTLQGLLGFLVLNHHRTHPREVLYTHFWGDQPEGRARRCLNTAFWRLRQVLEPPGVPRGQFLIATANGEIGFRRTSAIWLDADALEAAAATLSRRKATPLCPDDLAQLDQVFSASRGELLEGFCDDWALVARERFRLLMVRGLVDLTIVYREVADYPRAISTAERVIELDPLHEGAVRELMRAASATGDRVHALRRYSDLKRRLRSELNTEPLPETRMLARQIAAIAQQVEGPTLETPAGSPGTLGPLRRALRDVNRIRTRLAAAIRDLERPSSPSEP